MIDYVGGTTSLRSPPSKKRQKILTPRDLERVVLQAPFLIENRTPHSPAFPDIHTQGSHATFLVRSRLPRRIAPDYAAASCTPRPPRRLLLTEPAAPSPPLPCDAPSLAARAAVPPSASHRLPTPARRYSRCHRGSRETRPLLPIPHPCPARPPSLSSGKRATRSRLLANRRPAPVRAPRTRESVPAASSRRSRRDVLPVGAALLSPARPLFPFSMHMLLSSTIFCAERR